MLTPSAKRKAFGQHYLVDPNLIQLIVQNTLDLAAEHDCDTLLEIGPGQGALTHSLMDGLGRLSSPHTLLVCERDRVLIEKWSTESRIRLLRGDFLEVPPTDWLQTRPIGVVSNLPYSAGTAILNRLAQYPDRIAFMVLMFQLEVAERLRAEPNSRKFGSLSLWIQNRWQVTQVSKAPRTAFRPPPKVESEVVLLLPRAEPLIPATLRNPALWESLLKASFMHRRKMLRSGLPDVFWKKALETAQIDGTRRAESLDWNEWRRFYEAALEATQR